MDLFSTEKTIYNLPDAEISYHPNFINLSEANKYFQTLKKSIAWQQDSIKLFGNSYLQPRLTALYASNNTPYSYSSICMQPHPFTAELLAIKSQVESVADHKFTSVLLNYYRNGNDSNGWHADNEKALGINPVIASVSFGASRMFHFKHRHIKSETHKINLESGSLLIMKGAMQHHWLHQIPKTKQLIGERINLTFRFIA